MIPIGTDTLAVRGYCLRCLLFLLVLLGPVAGSNVHAQNAASSRLYPLASYETAPTEGLRQPVSLRTGRMALEDVLRDIGRQTGLVIVFNTNLIAARPLKALTLTDVAAADAINDVLDDTGLAAYLLPDGKVLIAEAQPDARASEPERRPPGQTIRGTVTDRDTQAPLPGANVVVLGTDPLIGTTTDGNGRFVLENVPLGRHRIQVSFIGFEPVILPNVLVTSGKEVVLQIELKEQIMTGDEVVVTPTLRKDQPLNDMALVSARSFTVEETRRYAGGLDDPARMASAFAGITGTSVENNALIIRGNAPKGVLWRLEGIDIPNPSHFGNLDVVGGGGVTLFSNQLLADSDVFVGAFPAEYGNALAGVFDMNLRSGNPTRREHAAQIGVVGIDVASEGPFVQGRPSTYLFNYRYSTLGLLMPLLPTSDVIRYQDLSFKLSFPTRKAGRFEVWGLGGLDVQRRSPASTDPDDWTYEGDRFGGTLDIDVGTAGLSHNLILGRQTYLHSTLALSAHRLRWEERRLDDALVLRDDMASVGTQGRGILQTYLNHKFNPRHVNRTGFTIQQLFYDFSVEVAPRPAQPLQMVAAGDGSSTLVQFYTQSRLDLHPRLSVNAGVHAAYFALTDRLSVEPRAGVQWQVRDGHALSLGYGLHSQIEDLRIYFAQRATDAGIVMPNRRLDFAKAHHGVLGYDLLLSAVTRLKLEAYYQVHVDVPVIPDSSYSLLNYEQDWSFNEALTNDGAGLNYGIEATLERFLQDGYYYLLTGSLFTSRYRGGDGVWRNTRFDRLFTANVLFGKEFALREQNNLLGLNVRLAYLGGLRHSPPDQAASREQGELVFDETRAFEHRFPAQLFLDLTVTYRRNHRRISEVWALQLKNALAANTRYWDYRYETNRYELVDESIILPMLSYKIEF